MERFLISTNPDKIIPPGVIPRDYDREDLIKLMIAYGTEPVKVEGDDQAIWVHFLPDEAEAFENSYYSNKQMVTTIAMQSHANDYWIIGATSWFRGKARNDTSKTSVGRQRN
jgi:hypothetical protein